MEQDYGLRRFRSERPSKFDVIYGMPGAEPASPVGTRYGTPKMLRIMGPSGYLQAIFDTEASSSHAISTLHPEKVPPKAAEIIGSVADLAHVPKEKVEQRELVTHHDMGAATGELADAANSADPEKKAGGYVHFSMTSADGTEPAKASQLYRGLVVLRESAKDLQDASLLAAHEWKYVPCIIRTHGQHAIPATFGLPFAVFAYNLQKDVARLDYDIENCIEGKISGAIGTYDVARDEGMDGRAIEKLALSRLGVKPAGASTQVPPRENIAHIMTDLAVLGGTVENMARYVRTLKRTEILELYEEPEKGAMASSAMPHKDLLGNPHVEERCVSIARLLRGFAATAMESVPMEDFRDLSASLSDRVIIPEGFELADYECRLMENVIYRVDINKDGVDRNLMLTNGVVTAQRVMSRLVAQGVPRKEARAMVGKDATAAFRSSIDFYQALVGDDAMLKFMTADELTSLSDPHTYIGDSVGTIERMVSAYLSQDKKKIVEGAGA